MGIGSFSVRSGETGQKNPDRLVSVCPLQASRDALFANCFAISRAIGTRIFSRTEVMAAQPTAAYNAEWADDLGWGPEDFIPVVYYQLGGGGRLADR